MAARRICGLAERELCAINRLGSALPGDFNVALSTLFGGSYHGMYQPDQTWQETPIGMPMEKAQAIFDQGSQTLVAAGLVWNSANSIISTTTRYYEVVGIHESVVEGGALGSLKCSHWEGPKLDEYDIPDKQVTFGKEDTFYVDSSILELVSIGMKVEMVVRKLDNGFRFFDSAGFFCSFYTYLENEKMMDYKEPVLSTRPGPTEDDPEAEERMMEGEMSLE